MRSKPANHQTNKLPGQYPLVLSLSKGEPARVGARPPIEIGGSEIESRAFQCAGLKCYGVAVRMAVLYLMARGKA